MRKRVGFSLVETLVVLAILAVLAALVIAALRVSSDAMASQRTTERLREATSVTLAYAAGTDDLAPGPDPADSTSEPIRYGNLELGLWTWGPSVAWPNRLPQELGLPVGGLGEESGVVRDVYTWYPLDGGGGYWSSQILLSAAFVFDPGTMTSSAEFADLRPQTQRLSRVRVPSRKALFAVSNYDDWNEENGDARPLVSSVDGAVRRVPLPDLLANQTHALGSIVTPTISGVRGVDW